MADQLKQRQELAAQLRVDSLPCTTAVGSGHPTSSLADDRDKPRTLCASHPWDPDHEPRLIGYPIPIERRHLIEQVLVGRGGFLRPIGHETNVLVQSARTSLRGSSGGYRQGEVKAGAGALMRGDPEAPGVILDNGSADRKPHPKSARLRCMEWLENVLNALGLKPNPGVTDGDLHLLLFPALCADGELTRPVLHCRHRIDGVQN